MFTAKSNNSQENGVYPKIQQQKGTPPLKKGPIWGPLWGPLLRTQKWTFLLVNGVRSGFHFGPKKDMKKDMFFIFLGGGAPPFVAGF